MHRARIPKVARLQTSNLVLGVVARAQSVDLAERDRSAIPAAAVLPRADQSRPPPLDGAGRTCAADIRDDGIAWMWTPRSPRRARGEYVELIEHCCVWCGSPNEQPQTISLCQDRRVRRDEVVEQDRLAAPCVREIHRPIELHPAHCRGLGDQEELAPEPEHERVRKMVGLRENGSRRMRRGSIEPQLCV